MNDKEITKFFHDNRPVPEDPGTYLVGLSARMDAAEEIKMLCEQSRKDSRRALLLTFILGCLSGAFVISLVIFCQNNMGGAFGINLSEVFGFLKQFRTAILILVPSLGMLLGYCLWKAYENT